LIQSDGVDLDYGAIVCLRIPGRTRHNLLHRVESRTIPGIR